MEKTKEHFSTTAWNKIPYDVRPGGMHRSKTTDEIRALAERELLSFSICQACEEKRRQEQLKKDLEAEQEAREAAAKDKASRKEHNIQFYDFGELSAQWVPTKPDQLGGEYDIIFHHGFVDEEVESRTTKGTVVLAENDGALSGRVEFHPDMRREIFHFQYDFTLDPVAELNRGTDWWAAHFLVNMTDEEAKDIVQVLGNDDEPLSGSLRCVEKRTAMPWMKHEEAEENDPEERVSFQTLEEAERLDKEHERGPDCSSSWLIGHKHFSESLAKHVHDYLWYKPKPVFFVEPGDLILNVEWSDDHREPAESNLILRKRK